MRHVHKPAESFGERMVGSDCLDEDARALDGKGVSLDSVEEQCGCMCGEAGEQSGRCGILCPTDELGQGFPVRLRPEIASKRLGSRDD